MPPTAAIAPRVNGILPGLAKLAPGLALCAVIAGMALLAGKAVPLVGAPLFAIAIGVVVANTLRDRMRLTTLKIGDISKMCLKTGIVILGASLDLKDIAHTGGNSLIFLAVTVVAGLGTALILGRSFGIDWRIRCLIGMGTTICGASAIAALAPVIRAKGEEIAYAVTVVFFFNMIAVFLFPVLGHLIGLSGQRVRHLDRDGGERHVGRRRGRVRVQQRCRLDRHDRETDAHDADHSAGHRLRFGAALAGPRRGVVRGGEVRCVAGPPRL